MRRYNELIGEIHNHNILIPTREIFFDSPDEDKTVSSGAAFNFLKNLKLLEHINNKPILLHLFSDGGDWDAGMAIYDAIKSCPLDVNIICYGTVASAATIILQAGTIRISMPNCTFMIHEGWTGIHNDLTRKQTDSWQKSEKATEEIIYNIYAQKCVEGFFFQKNKATTEAVKNFIKNQLDKYSDWILNTHDALNYGFIDYIFNDKTMSVIRDIKS